MHAPTANMTELVKHYIACKAAATPEVQLKTKAVFVVTHFLYTRHADLFQNMHVLQTYKRGAIVNLHHKVGKPATLTKCSTTIHILYDGPVTPDMTGIVTATTTDEPPFGVPTSFTHPKQVLMTVKGLVSGATATVGLDTFAQGNGYVSQAFVTQHRLHTTPVNSTKVTLGDGKSTAIVATACKVFLKLGSFTTSVWLFVMPIPETVDVLLGDQFFRTHGARLAYDKQALVIPTPTKLHTVFTLEAQQAKASKQAIPPPPLQILSYIQIKRAIKKCKAKDKIVLCFVDKDEPTLDFAGITFDKTTNAWDLSSLHPDVAALIREYPDVFPTALQLSELRDDMPEVIPIEPGHKTPNMPLYRYSPAQDTEIRRQVKELLEQGLIEPSTSPYGAPVLLVPKPDGSWRMCVDYRALNKITTKNAYPLPRVDDLIDKLTGAKFFSSLDLLSGYNQLRLRNTDVTKTAFKTTAGLFQYKVLCFGLCNAPSVFQAVMNKVFSTAGILNQFVIVYMDDILIYSKTEEEHLQHIKQVIDILKKENLSTKLSKCNFFQSELKYLGHIISADGVKVDPAKVEAVKKWKYPKTQTELRGFLGLTNFFRKFIKNYAKLAEPLNALTKKCLGPSVLLNDEALAAFLALKQALIEAPILTLPDFSKPFQCYVDASQFGVGGVLMQGSHVIAYESRSLNTVEVNYGTPDRELLAAVHCLKKWKPYMMSHPLNELITDHKPNVTVATKTDLSPRQIRWIEFLQQFPVQWKYEKGVTNPADPLSRLSLSAFLCASLNVSPDPTPLTLLTLIPQLKAAYKADPVFSEGNKIDCVNGLYYHKDRIYVPNNKELRQQIVLACHSDSFAGHMGQHKTSELVARWFYWPNLAHDVQTFVKNCPVCQVSKSGKEKIQGLLQPLPVPPRPWYSVSVDFITGLPLTNRGHDAILTITDRLTRLVHLVPTTTTCDSLEFAYLFTTHVIAKHGVPNDFVCDRGAIFTGKFWVGFCSSLRMHLSTSSAYHPQSDGATEIVNKLVEQVLRCHCMGSIHSWDEHLGMVEFAINNSHHASLQHTPFFLTYGLHPVTPLTVDTLKLSKVPAAANWTKDMTDVLKTAQ